MKRPLIVFPTTCEAYAVFKFFGDPMKCRLGGKCKFPLANGTECEALVAGVGCEKSANRVREELLPNRHNPLRIRGRV